MLEFNPDKLRLELAQAETADLLDRVTAYRAAMEPDAVDLIEQELRCRGVTAAEIAVHAEACERECLFDDTGTALRCSRCRRPAVVEVSLRHRLWGVVPVFPRRVRLCKVHQERSEPRA